LPRLHALQQALASATPPVTFSAGVASLGPHGNTLDDLMRVADDALYRAKDSGRDRVLVGPGLHGRG
jgi:diguanylate cyclase (GGDEF)-like protein